MLSGTLGATAKEVAQAHLHKESPFFIDKEAVFPGRGGCMSLDTVRKGDAVQAKVRYPKDYDRCLVTSDILLAQPVLGHPAKTGETRRAWSTITKPPLEEVSRARSKLPIGSFRNRPCDLALTTEDIELAQPGKQKLFHQPRPPICESSRIGPRSFTAAAEATAEVQGLMARAPMSARLTRQLEEHPALAKLRPTTLTPRVLDPRSEQRQDGNEIRLPAGLSKSLETADIEGARPSCPIPVRKQYGDPLKCEDEFRSTARVQDARRLAQPELASAEEAAAGQRARRAPLTPRLEGPQRSGRETNPQMPRYRHQLVDGGAYMHCQWYEERDLPQASPAEWAEIGEVDGGRAKTLPVRKEVLCSLRTDDIEGAAPGIKIGALNQSIWTSGHRPELAHKLDSKDIPGAQADTQNYGPPIYGRRKRAVVDA